MNREQKAKWLAISTAASVVLLTAIYSSLHYTDAPHQTKAMTPAASSSAQSQSQNEAARRAFKRLGCGMCHSIAGEGNPDSPLDGVGSRLSRREIRDWTLGTGVSTNKLPASVVRRKQRAKADNELDFVIDFLFRLKK